MNNRNNVHQEQEDFFYYLINNIPFSLFVVVNNDTFSVEDICIAPVTENMILKTPEPIILFPAVTSEFEKFKSKHLKGMELSTLPGKSFLRFDLKDTQMLPNYSLYTGENYVQNILIPMLYKEVVYNKTFEEECILRANGNVMQSDSKDFAENRNDFSVSMIMKYKDIPHITEKQVSSFLFENLSNPEVFVGKNEELKALQDTQYYKINKIFPRFDIIDDRKILPIDILIAFIKGEEKKADLHHLYSLQKKKATLKFTPSWPFMYKQVQIVLDLYRETHPFDVEMSQELMLETDKLPKPINGSLQYEIMTDLLKDYRTLAICNKNLKTVQDEKNREDNRMKQDITFANIMIKQLKLFECVEQVTNSWQQRFADLGKYWWEINTNLPLNYNALLLKYEELEEKIFPGKGKIYCNIKFETKDVFFPLIQNHLANIICDRSLIYMKNDVDFGIEDINSLWKHYEEMSQCNPNDLMIFHTQFITNADLIAVDTDILKKFIEEYLDSTGFLNSFYLTIIEEKGQQVEVNIFIQNNESGKLRAYNPMMHILAKTGFNDCLWNHRLPLYPLENNIISENLKNYLANTPPQKPQSSSKKTSLKM